MAALPRIGVAVAAIVATAGCETGRTDLRTADGGPDLPMDDLTGRWAMFYWENPVAVDLRQTAGVLEGEGCCAGFPGDNTVLNCCGLLSGTIADRRASFGFSFEDGGSYEYATDVVVSANGQRMAGTFNRSGYPVAWVRIGTQEAWLSSDGAIAEVSMLISGLSGSYTVVLSDDPAPGTDFVAQHAYSVHLHDGFLSGELGSFWSGEMSWNADAQTLIAGPVPETSPGLPVSLSLQFEATTLASVEATMASGVQYHFQPPPSQP